MSNSVCEHCFGKGYIGIGEFEKDCEHCNSIYLNGNYYVFSLYSDIYNYIYGNYMNKLVTNDALIIMIPQIIELFNQIKERKYCVNKFKKLIEITKCHGLKIVDILIKYSYYIFRCACANDDIKLSKFILSINPNIDLTYLEHTIFKYACENYSSDGSHKDFILLLLEKEPYVYSYSFETKKYKINHSQQEQRDARWNIKRLAVMSSSHLKKNDTILYWLPSDLSRIVIEYLYKK
jgi:hypothetical protein